MIRAIAALLVIGLVGSLGIPAFRSLIRTEGGGEPSEAGGTVTPEDLERARSLAACVQSDLTLIELDVGDDPETAVVAIADAVERLRELKYVSPPQVEFVTRPRLAGRVKRSFESEYPVARSDDDDTVLKALGAIPLDSSLRADLKVALSGQVAGFYVPGSKELVVGSTEGAPGPLAQLILAHELEHALADQNLKLPTDGSVGDPKDADRDLAALALIEGDATLTMQRFSQAGLAISDQLSLLDDPSVAAGTTGLEHLSPFLSRQLLFPYLDGLAFVCELRAVGGWPAVDRSYSEPPVSTAQVLFPERYFAGEQPVDVRDPASPGPDWGPPTEFVIGAADLLWLFEAPGGRVDRALGDPRAAAAAWAGGELTLWRRGYGSAIGIGLAQRPGEVALCDAVSAWYERAWAAHVELATEPGEVFAHDGPFQDAVLRCAEDEVRLGIGPEISIARELVQ